MNTIYMPYALANIKFDSFKEIDSSEYYRVNQVSVKIARQIQEKYRPRMDISSGSYKKKKELQEYSIVATQRYNILQQQINDIKRVNQKILAEGEYLRDIDSPDKISWILTGRNRITELNKHNEQYKWLYSQLCALNNEMSKLEPYIKSNLDETIRTEQSCYEESLAITEARRRDEWDSAYRVKLNNLTSELGQARSYSFLVRWLWVITNGSECKISCQRKLIDSDKDFEYITTTFINKTISISR